MGWKSFLFKLLVDKEDNLDTSQIVLLTLNIFFMTMVGLIGARIWFVPEYVIEAFLVIYGATLILAAPFWTAKMLIEAKYPFRKPSEPPKPTPEPPSAGGDSAELPSEDPS